MYVSIFVCFNTLNNGTGVARTEQYCDIVLTYGGLRYIMLTIIVTLNLISGLDAFIDNCNCAYRTPLDALA